MPALWTAPTIRLWAERHVVVCELPGVAAEMLGSLVAGSRCVMLGRPAQGSIASRYSDYALSCFERIRAVLSGKPEGAVLMQVVVGESGEDAVFSGLSALLKTATLENPLFRGQLVLTGREVTTAALAQQLEQARAHVSEPVIRFDRGTQPQGLGWQVQPQVEMPCEPVFKEHGVYLITGGLGGLGVLFAQTVLEQTRHGRVILTGRGALSGGKQSRFDALVALGAGRIRYRSLELADRAQVDGAIAEILAGEGGLHGILHCAGMIADNFILKKSASEFREVLSPKVTGTWHLDEATRAMSDWIFSRCFRRWRARSGTWASRTMRRRTGSWTGLRGTGTVGCRRASAVGGRSRSTGRCGPRAGCSWTRRCSRSCCGRRGWWRCRR